MRILYLDAASSGLAGDMLFAALLDAGADFDSLLARLRGLPLDSWRIDYSRVRQHGLEAADIAIHYPPQHIHRHLEDILAIIAAAGFPPRAEAVACRAFELLAAAEATAHGCDKEQVHFHEVGAVDSILDICGVALAADALDIGAVYASALPLSQGFVDCEHGRLPVPAPAALHLLRGWPLSASDLMGELVTPTGAALLRALEAQPKLPDFTLCAVGQGAGKRQLPRPNILRALVGETAAAPIAGAGPGFSYDQVDVIEANIDDSSGEMLAALWDRAFALGAKDMCYTPLLMKKGRPAWQVQLIVPWGEAARFAPLLFAETSAIGCRCRSEQRILAPRRSIAADTAYGPIAVKISGQNIAPEADSVQAAAARHNTPFKQVYQAALAAAYDDIARQGEDKA